MGWLTVKIMAGARGVILQAGLWPQPEGWLTVSFKPEHIYFIRQVFCSSFFFNVFKNKSETYKNKGLKLKLPSSNSVGTKVFQRFWRKVNSKRETQLDYNRFYWTVPATPDLLSNIIFWRSLQVHTLKLASTHHLWSQGSHKHSCRGFLFRTTGTLKPPEIYFRNWLRCIKSPGSPLALLSSRCTPC